VVRAGVRAARPARVASDVTRAKRESAVDKVADSKVDGADKLVEKVADKVADKLVDNRVAETSEI
jgi:hypothetical protein